MVDMMTREALAEKYQFTPAYISHIKREMIKSGLFDDMDIWEGPRYLRISEEAFCWFMSMRKKIKNGQYVKPYKRR